MRALALSTLAATAVGDGDVVAGDREHLRDAVAHQARADHCDAGFGHDQPAV